MSLLDGYNGLCSPIGRAVSASQLVLVVNSSGQSCITGKSARFISIIYNLHVAPNRSIQSASLLWIQLTNERTILLSYSKLFILSGAVRPFLLFAIGVVKSCDPRLLSGSQLDWYKPWLWDSMSKYSAKSTRVTLTGRSLCSLHAFINLEDNPKARWSTHTGRLWLLLSVAVLLSRFHVGLSARTVYMAIS